jgi:hypothetical protein
VSLSVSRLQPLPIVKNDLTYILRTNLILVVATAMLGQTILITEVNGAKVFRESCYAVGEMGEEESSIVVSMKKIQKLAKQLR